MSENKIQNLDPSVLDQIVGGATTVPSALTPYMDKKGDCFRVYEHSAHTSGSLEEISKLKLPELRQKFQQSLRLDPGSLALMRQQHVSLPPN